MTPCFCYYSLSSSILSTSHIRSFCLSFLLLAILFTFLNFLTTTTSINKWTTNEYNTELNSTTTKSSLPLLSINAEDVYQNRFNCYGRTNHQRFHRNRNNSNTIQLNQPNKTSFERHTIPYEYDIWQSASTMPRLVTKCEHHLMMQLLKRFDQLATKYSLEYMMIDGTLLGKYIFFIILYYELK